MVLMFYQLSTPQAPQQKCSHMSLFNEKHPHFIEKQAPLVFSSKKKRKDTRVTSICIPKDSSGCAEQYYKVYVTLNYLFKLL